MLFRSSPTPNTPPCRQVDDLSARFAAAKGAADSELAALAARARADADELAACKASLAAAQVRYLGLDRPRDKPLSNRGRCPGGRAGAAAADAGGAGPGDGGRRRGAAHDERPAGARCLASI